MKEELLFDEISERDQNVNNCAHLERKGEGRRKTGKRKIHQWTAHMSRRVCSAKLCGASWIHAVRTVQNGGRPRSVEPLSYAIPRVTGESSGFSCEYSGPALGKKTEGWASLDRFDLSGKGNTMLAIRLALVNLWPPSLQTSLCISPLLPCRPTINRLAMPFHLGKGP